VAVFDEQGLLGESYRVVGADAEDDWAFTFGGGAGSRGGPRSSSARAPASPPEPAQRMRGPEPRPSRNELPQIVVGVASLAIAETLRGVHPVWCRPGVGHPQHGGPLPEMRVAMA